LIQDSIVSFAAIIDAGMRDQFAHHMLGEKLRGLGGNEYLGVITDTGGATISVAREAASKIRGIDITNMTKRLWRRRNAIWIANHDTKGEISRLGLGVYDSGATPLSGAAILYRPSLAPGQPEMLDGLPLFYSEYASQLGTAGDLVLSDWSQYLDGLYQPIQSAESMHVRFLNREQTFMLWLRNAGAPWWRSPLTPHKGTNTLAPFVILGAAA
jgi:HK97 family phage major capsid protein